MDSIPAELLAAGLVAMALGALAWWGDHRRARRADPDAVGFMPWTGVFLLATLAACVLLGLAARAWVAG